VQIIQPGVFGLGVFLLIEGGLMAWGGFYRVRRPMPQVRGWWLIWGGLVQSLVGLVAFSSACDLPHHMSARTLSLIIAEDVAGSVILVLVLSRALAMRKNSRP